MEHEKISKTDEDRYGFGSQFQKYLPEDSIEVFNHEVGSHDWVGAKVDYLSHLRSEFLSREHDCTSFINESGMSLLQRIRIEGDKIFSDHIKLTSYMKSLGLKPIPYGWDTVSWCARCPNSDVSYELKINTNIDEWECRYCGRQGGYEEFNKWMFIIDNNKLTMYYKAINSGEELAPALRKWWWDCY